MGSKRHLVWVVVVVICAGVYGAEYYRSFIPIEWPLGVYLGTDIDARDKYLMLAARLFPIWPWESKEAGVLTVHPQPPLLRNLNYKKEDAEYIYEQKHKVTKSLKKVFLQVECWGDAKKVGLDAKDLREEIRNRFRSMAIIVKDKAVKQTDLPQFRVVVWVKKIKGTKAYTVDMALALAERVSLERDPKALCTALTWYEHWSTTLKKEELKHLKELVLTFYLSSEWRRYADQTTSQRESDRVMMKRKLEEEKRRRQKKRQRRQTQERQR